MQMLGTVGTSAPRSKYHFTVSAVRSSPLCTPPTYSMSDGYPFYRIDRFVQMAPNLSYRTPHRRCLLSGRQLYCAEHINSSCERCMKSVLAGVAQARRNA